MPMPVQIINIIIKDVETKLATLNNIVRIIQINDAATNAFPAPCSDVISLIQIIKKIATIIPEKNQLSTVPLAQLKKSPKSVIFPDGFA